MGYSDEGLGRIVRVRMEAEAPSIEECQRTLNSGFMTIHSALAGFVATARTSLPGVGTFEQPSSYASVFSRESVFGEEVYESFVTGHGAIHFRGRRSMTFEEAPFDPEAALAPLAMTGTLASDDDRIRAIQRMPEAGSCEVLRLPNGVWRVSVYKRGPGLMDAPPAGGDVFPGPEVMLALGQGGTLREALEDAEAQLELAPDGGVLVVEADAEEILDGIRRLVNVHDVGVVAKPNSWNVIVTLDPTLPSSETDMNGQIVEAHESLREAALAAYGRCGQTITHYDAVPREG